MGRAVTSIYALLRRDIYIISLPITVSSAENRSSIQLSILIISLCERKQSLGNKSTRRVLNVDESYLVIYWKWRLRIYSVFHDGMPLYSRTKLCHEIGLQSWPPSDAMPACINLHLPVDAFFPCRPIVSPSAVPDCSGFDVGLQCPTLETAAVLMVRKRTCKHLE